jgi:hypothetical protein
MGEGFEAEIAEVPDEEILACWVRQQAGRHH